ncbi:MAG: transglutaminase domain-containing protein [Alphaproteobacteria bacterium]|nr:transglutaminase domain-containing protein [Alphaproteobacteria bacterium]
MRRRTFLAASAVAPFAGALSFATQGHASPAAGRWRSFDMTYAVDIPANSGPTKIWLPLPHDAPYQRLESMSWSGTAPISLYTDLDSGARAVHAAWADGGEARKVTLNVRAGILPRSVPLASGASGGAMPDDVKKFLAPNAMIRTDGIVKETADKIVAGKSDPLTKAQLVFDWIVENTFRDPKVKGCGIGDIRAMLVTGNLGGKCGDLNALFVGLLRAAGVPARGVYGVRVAPSAHYSAMGTRNVDISKAQHCRAEFWTAATGWVPADPADVRKVVLDDKLTLNEPKMADLRRFLFGSWEANWVAFNHSRDVKLAPSSTVVNFFMYPEGETAKGPLDGVDPDAYGYKITVREATT